MSMFQPKPGNWFGPGSVSCLDDRFLRAHDKNPLNSPLSTAFLVRDSRPIFVLYTGLARACKPVRYVRSKTILWVIDKDFVPGLL
jgi:hypothetical protein